MPNPRLFSNARDRADTKNDAGGLAYSLPAKAALAQFACTGTFNGTFYTSEEKLLKDFVELAKDVDDEYLAKLAVYAREYAKMKDMSAALLVVLSTRDNELTHRIFDRVVDNGRMLRTTFQFVRSGQFGRRGLSSSLQRAFRRWLNNRDIPKLLNDSTGNNPTMRDVLRMVRPRPENLSREALFAYLVKKELEPDSPVALAVPEDLRLLKEFRKAESQAEQIEILERLHLRWELLADSIIGPDVWAKVGLKMGAHALLANLNTLDRHGAFKVVTDGSTGIVAQFADRIRGTPKAGIFPYRYFAAYKYGVDAPLPIQTALLDATKLAFDNVPKLPGPVVIAIDVSASMRSSITGRQAGGRRSSQIECLDVAALFGAAVAHRNPESVILPFCDHIHRIIYGHDGGVMSLARSLAHLRGFATACDVPIRTAKEIGEQKSQDFCAIVLVSDHESWLGHGRFGESATYEAFKRFKASQKAMFPGARPKLICIDLTPGRTALTPKQPDILNVGGFSDAVFETIKKFLDSDGDPDSFVKTIEEVSI